MFKSIDIDKKETGRQIRRYMNLCGVSVQDIKEFLSLGCVQSVYHWISGQSLPTLDNLYALSVILGVPMDMLVCGKEELPEKMQKSMERKRVFVYARVLRALTA